MDTNEEIPGLITETPVIEKEIGDILVDINDENVETLVEGSFTWQIEKWDSMTNDKYISPRVKIGDFEWNLLLFPQGNHNKSLAVYLEPHPEEKKNDISSELEPVDPDWYCCAQFAVILSKPDNDQEVNLCNRSHHRFNAADTDWGFANFIDIYALKNQVRGRPSGFINEGKVNFTVYVRILKDSTGVLWHNFINYDSKKVTGYVGFRNQGATCYLNSLLQSYFFTKYFRKLVYGIPTNGENPNDSVPLALQRAFYQLQVSKFPLDTLELTRSFGWDTADAFTQHDVQELNRILMDRLENRMKGTNVEGKLNEIFVGKMKSYIRCKNVDYESSRVEDFWDIQLNVKNFKSLQESFENYIEVELMNGENQYAAPDFGLQDAYKGVVFESFPAVLHLQLKRFEYDFNYDQLIKVNDRYEFPDKIDLAPYMDKELLKKTPGPKNYKLHGVLVHTGDISTGHYYAMIKPTLEDQWYRFDDEKVWKVDKKQVFDENFGLDRLPDSKLRSMTREEYQSYLITRHTNAYMLVYICEGMEETTLQNVDELDVPEHVVKSIKKENEEREVREKELKEAHLYVNIRAHSIQNFIHYQGFDISPNAESNLYNEELCPEESRAVTLRVPRNTYLKDLYKNINETLGIPHGKNVRFWKMDYRKNGSLRLETPVTSNLDSMTLEEATNSKRDQIIPPMDIFVEEPYLDLNFIAKLKEKNLIGTCVLDDELINKLRTSVSKLIPQEELPVIFDPKEYDLLFIKVFNRFEQTLIGFGNVAVKKQDKVSKLSNVVSSVLNLSSPVNFYEELNPGEVYVIPNEKQVYAAELTTGDILTFEVPTENNPEKFPSYDTIPEFYHYLRYRVKLVFTKSKNSTEEYVLENSSPDKFEFWVSTYISYNNLANIVSKYTNVNPDYLTLVAVYPNARYSLKTGCILKDYLIRDYNCELIPPFEYEVLSLPLKELEHLKSIKLYWLKDSYVHYQIYEFKVPRTCIVSDFLEKIKNKIGFSEKEKENILLWTNSNFQFESVLFEDNTLDEVGKSQILFGRVLPEELKLIKELDDLENVNESENDISMVQNNNSGEVLDKNTEISRGRLVIIMQYFKDLDHRHGISFLFNLIPGENLAETKARLHERFGLGQKEFSKIKLNLLLRSKGNKSLMSLQDYSSEEETKLVLYDVMGHLDCIYMDHPDRLRSQTTHDRPMMIKN
ncbi:hypothetical protein Kpol_513p25 [Vanderwaltozyma polyspora DSM 70294]|uniref:ubiquitinyl hydrolase 1 n=1 Tax=Vanderwaltozyma polyspora (strain ATCC 22028 / DSM 70294 / BCRC 21397 / CBS 2163 / NBRC 10782 / NRRL Y-8283 / UCD 57-17) TaxID=436907 RepID=A7TML1_VANPO|nr:uncharacterized protein Kpol_513p25 [Vanderwaltozyma polyspora DSM 70294]EDO16509.1 hypothetical protein Kpol_513p25 [Vanderwaltozyma polyspora DSM 70294]